MKKKAFGRRVATLGAAILLVMTMTLSVAAADSITTVPIETEPLTTEAVTTVPPETEPPTTEAPAAPKSEEEETFLSNFWNKLTSFTEGLFSEGGALGWVLSPIRKTSSLFNAINDLTKGFFQIEGYVIANGGYDPQAVQAINGAIGKIYPIIYPFGMGILLVCWMVHATKSGVTGSLDIRQKNSIAQIGVSIVIGLVAMGIAPRVLSLLTSISYSLCRQLAQSGAFSSILEDALIQGGVFTLLSGNGLLATIVSGLGGTDAITDGVAYGVFVLVIKWVFYVNLLYLGLLQALSPIFIGFAGGGNTTGRLVTNYVREYIKSLLIPPVTVAYAALCTQVMNSSLGLILSLVLSFSTISVAGKKLDKLI